MLDQTPLQLHPQSLPLWVSLAGNLKGVEGASDYSREAIILNISVKAEGGDAINPAAAIIRGNTVVTATKINSGRWKVGEKIDLFLDPLCT